jgi:hypothetical protein
MTKFIIMALACLAFTTTPAPDCNTLHTGTFRINSDMGDYLVTRTKTKQVEDVLSTGMRAEFKIKWLNKCTYVLYNRTIVKGEDDMPTGYQFDTLYCNITEIRGATHKVYSHFKDDPGMTSTLKKIK